VSSGLADALLEVVYSVAIHLEGFLGSFGLRVEDLAEESTHAAPPRPDLRVDGLECLFDR
jgi:hypothetical protein